MKKGKLFLICTFILFSFLFFLYTIEKEEDHFYYMKFSNKQVVVYNKDHTVYEYTNLSEEFLPTSLVNELKEGKYFKDQQELYEFLETYTS